MIYASIDALPDHVRSCLTEEAQQCYLLAHNAVSARARLAAGATSGDDLTGEAERAAWEAVRRVYEQDEQGHWRRRSQIEQPWSGEGHQIDRR